MRHLLRFGAPAVAFLLLVGCAPPDEQPIEAPALEVHPDAVGIGDPVGRFHLTALYAQPSPKGSWYGEARFEGMVELRGRYFDFDGENADAANPRPCFEVDEHDAHLLPRFPGDERRTWFCFDNPDDVMAEAGAPTRAGRLLTITIIRYLYVHEPTDVVNRATIMVGAQRQREPTISATGSVSS